MTPAEVDALRADLRSRIVMETAEETGETFTVTVVTREATPAEGLSLASDDLAAISRTLDELDALAARGFNLGADLRRSWLAHRADALRRLSRYSLARLRLRRHALTSGLSEFVDRAVEVLDEIAVALSRLALGRLVDGTHTPPPTVTLGLWPAPPTAPPTLSAHRHRMERPT